MLGTSPMLPTSIKIKFGLVKVMYILMFTSLNVFNKMDIRASSQFCQYHRLYENHHLLSQPLPLCSKVYVLYTGENINILVSVQGQVTFLSQSRMISSSRISLS